VIRIGLHPQGGSPWVLAACIAVYLIAIAAIVYRMRSRHRSAWERLGGLAFLDRTSDNRFTFAKYTLFSSAYRELDDPVLNVLVAIARILLALSAFLFVAPIVKPYLT